MISTSPDDRFALAADLGLDKLFVYHFDAEAGDLRANDPPFVQLKAGAGPRHFCFAPSGRFAYVVSEMASTVTVFSYDARSGTFKEIQVASTVPKGYNKENTGAEIEVHPTGKFLYASNRGLNSIAVFSVDQAKGTLTQVEQVPTGGRAPRAFELDPTGSFLFVTNQISGNLVMFRINRMTGRLTRIGAVNVPIPACVKFVPADS